MRFSLIFFLITFNAFALKPNCTNKIDKLAGEVSEWHKYGIVKDAQGVAQFPKKCTPFMKRMKMIPLPKRNAGGKNRERYLGRDCKTYEWDSQHGGFETYRPSGNNESFYHEGESSGVHGDFDPKAIAKRDHNVSDTGFDGQKMKDICKKHKKGQINEKMVKKSKGGKSQISCL